MDTTPVVIKPWFREPWPWLLLLAPALSIIGGVAMYWLAVHSDDGLVVDDYYKQGMAINRTLARDDEARAGSYLAVLRWDERKGELTLALRTTAPQMPAALRLRLLHPTRAGLDRELSLPRAEARTYRVSVNDLPAGRRLLIVDDAQGQWRLLGDADMGTAGGLTLQARR